MNTNALRSDILTLSLEELAEIIKAHEATFDYALIQEISILTDLESSVIVETLADICANKIDQNASILRLALHAEILKNSHIPIAIRLQEAFKEIETISSLSLFRRLEAFARLGFLRLVEKNRYQPDIEVLVFEMKEALDVSGEENVLLRWIQYLENEQLKALGVEQLIARWKEVGQTSNDPFKQEIDNPISKTVLVAKLASLQFMRVVFQEKVETDIETVREFVASHLHGNKQDILSGSFDDQMVDILLSVMESEEGDESNIASFVVTFLESCPS
jgi:hypothetical protein